MLDMCVKKVYNKKKQQTNIAKEKTNMKKFTLKAARNYINSTRYDYNKIIHHYKGTSDDTLGIIDVLYVITVNNENEMTEYRFYSWKDGNYSAHWRGIDVRNTTYNDCYISVDGDMIERWGING